MSNIPNNDDGLNDADFATLFSADNNQPPKELDKLILDNALLSQHDSLSKPQETFTQKYAPLFGLAAILLIAIAVTPLMMNAPESKPDLVTGRTSLQESARVSAGDSVQVSVNQQVSADHNNLSSRTTLATPESASTTSEPISTANESLQNTTAVSTAADTVIDSDTNSIVASSSEANTVTATSGSEVSAEIETEPKLSVVAESTSAEFTEPSSMAEADTDAPGINTDDVMARVTEQAGSEDTRNTSQAELNRLRTEAEGILTFVRRAAKVRAARRAAEKAAESNSTPNSQVLNGDDSAVQKTAAAEINRPDFAEVRRISSTNALNVDRKDTADELQESAALSEFESEMSALAPNTTSTDESTRLSQAPELDVRLNIGRDTRQSTSPARTESKNYRSSALLWVIEIRHLFNEQNTDQAREELVLFRKKYPDNDNERLLPKNLLDSVPD